MFTPEQIQGTTEAPLANIQQQWPLVVGALQWAGIDSHWVRVGLIPTIARETGVFFPIEEEGGWAYYVSILGEQEARWHGRGLIQLTWSTNYKHFGDLLGLDLLNHPELALDPAVSARVLALYCRERGTAAAANAQNWERVQTSVNGGYVNYNEIFLPVLRRVLALVEPPDTHPVTTLMVNASLKTHPDHTGPPANPVVADLAKGCEVTFDGPDGTPFGIEGDWARVRVLHGTTQKLRNASGLLGWLLRADLRTK